METGIYLRVSTDEQAQEGYSIRGQEQKLKDYARIKDWFIYKIYVDEGISGKNITERPAMNELIADVKAGHVKNVLVFKIDRLTRSTSDLLYLVELFNQHDCAFNSLMESIDTQTPSGRMFLKIIGIFAEFERENIIERVKLGVERKVKEGYSLATAHISYGYDKEKGQKIQTINETEAMIVKEIFDMYVKQGLSLLGIAKQLNIRKIPTKENSVWSNRTVKQLLSNCTYIGQVRHRTANPEETYSVEGLHKPIISVELFEQAQVLLIKNARANPTKHPKEDACFSGVLFCAKCGARMFTKMGNDQKNYVCNNRMLKACDAAHMSHKKVEEAFRFYIEHIDPLSELDQIEMQKQEQEKERNHQLIEAYQKKLEQLARKEKELMKIYVDDDIDYDTYKAMRKQIGNDRTAIQEELTRLDVPEEKNEPVIKREDIITDLKAHWNAMTNHEKRQFLIQFVKRIEVVNEIPEGNRLGKVRIVSVEFHCE